jgi:hypothetical protein
MSKIPPELRETATEAIGIERQEVGSWKFGHDARNVEESRRFGKEEYGKCTTLQKNAPITGDERVYSESLF